MAARDAAPARPSDAGPASDIYVHDAPRCADCHDAMFQQWQGSAHARAASSPVFAAMRRSVDDRAACDVCHRPLARYRAAAPAVAEGVTCDVCHTLREITATKTPAPRFELEVAQPVKYGPYCELADHYFHRMGCSPLHRKSALCAACHERQGDGSRVYTTWSEWRETRYAERGVQCQDCHMPAVRAPIAEGGAVRDRVGDHRVALPAGGASLEVSARAEGEALAVTAAVVNKGAGHHLPTGSPDRRLVVRAVALDPAGREVGRAEIGLNRIPAGGREVGVVRLTGAPAAGALRVELVRRAMDPAIAAGLGVEPPADQVMLSAELPYRAAHRARDLARRVRGRP